jgi:hypothetical protein
MDWEHVLGAARCKKEEQEVRTFLRGALMSHSYHLIL